MEYGTHRIPKEERSYGFWDLTVTWFGSGVNTGSWFFGGMAAALGLGFVLQYSLIYLPLMMIPWAMIGWIAWKHGASTVTSTIPSLGVKGARIAGIGEFFGMIGWPAVNTFIAAISLLVAGRIRSSMAPTRSVPWPTRQAAFTAAGAASTAAM